jgi:hypothetical protein
VIARGHQGFFQHSLANGADQTFGRSYNKSLNVNSHDFSVKAGRWLAELLVGYGLAWLACALGKKSQEYSRLHDLKTNALPKGMGSCSTFWHPTLIGLKILSFHFIVCLSCPVWKSFKRADHLNFLAKFLQGLSIAYFASVQRKHC